MWEVRLKRESRPGDERIRRLLKGLRRALHEAISESSAVHLAWRELRQEGYSLHLVLDCQPVGEERDEDENSVEAVVAEPRFRIDGRDLAFLKSIGIDPTRRRPRSE